MTDIWLFGYGSLIWKVDFAFEQRELASVHGYARRFWQGSHDHRGTPEAPGRVVTLVPAAGEICTGMAYRISAEVATEVFDHLDYREKNGYQRLETEFHFRSRAPVQGRIYIAVQGNPAWLGPASAQHLAEHINAAYGPSGSNREYLLELAAALRDIGASDAHIFELEKAVLALG